MISEFRGKRVTVMGLGSFGGGIGAVQFLAGQGAVVTVSDLKPAGDLAESLKPISGLQDVTLHLGGHDERDFRDADLIVASPAVPRDNRYLQAAREEGIAVTSEMNLFWERNRGRTICVTGSNGKSTTAALIHACLTAGDLARDVHAPHFRVPGATAGPTAIAPAGAGELASPARGAADGTRRRVWLGGNIGGSLLPAVEQIQTDDWVILELSSFQLEELAVLHPNPHVAVVTNFTPNHLDRHGTVEKYRAAKQNILNWQTPDRFAVLNQSDADVLGWPTTARKFWFGREDEGRQGMFAIGFDSYKRQALFRFGPREQVFPLGKWLALPGVHNFQNALAAACTALVLGEGPPDIEAGLAGFAGLPHRLQLVAEIRGRKFFDDSKATTPEATLLAVEAFRSPVVLLAGGYDKGIDLGELARGIVARRVKAVALLGQTARKLKELIREADPHGGVAARVHVTFDAAFQWAAAQAEAGDTVLLSPGCASTDWFPNYEARGDEFTRLAQGWQPAESTAVPESAGS
jgi:UDP-N-acetylmuramoylalanine--D-glutamate ligase